MFIREVSHGSRALAVAFAASLLSTALSAQAAGAGPRMVVRTSPCRSAPNAAAGVIRTYRIGNVVDVDSVSSSPNPGWLATETMYISGVHPVCWLAPIAATVLRRNADPTPALLMIADTLLGQRTPARFEDYVEGENLLIDTYAYATKASGLLQFRRLQLIAKANDALDAIHRPPLEWAWVLAHREFLTQDPFGSDQDIEKGPYAQLFAKYENEAWADDLFWTLTRIMTPMDDGCDMGCAIEIEIGRPQEYWTRFPRGKWVAKALTEADAAAARIAQAACSDRDKDHPKGTDETRVTPELTQSIRASLAEVAAPEKRSLLAHLAAIDAKCK